MLPDLYSVIVRLHSCISMTLPLSSVSVRPLNCFLEAGDFGQGDKGNGMKHSLAVYLCLFLQGRGSLLSLVHLLRQRREQVVLIPRVSEAEETLVTSFKPISNCHQPYQQQKPLVGETCQSIQYIHTISVFLFWTGMDVAYSADATESTKNVCLSPL